MKTLILAGLLGTMMALSACAGIHGEAQADHKGGRGRADVFSIPFP